MEKIIQEFRVIETDDGYRIEIKGDKERMKSFIHGIGPRKHWRRRWKRRWRGPFGYGPLAWMRAMCFDGPWDYEEGPEEEEAKEA